MKINAKQMLSLYLTITGVTLTASCDKIERMFGEDLKNDPSAHFKGYWDASVSGKKMKMLWKIQDQQIFRCSYISGSNTKGEMQSAVNIQMDDDNPNRFQMKLDEKSYSVVLNSHWNSLSDSIAVTNINTEGIKVYSRANDEEVKAFHDKCGVNDPMKSE